MNRLANKIAVITGASSGIGRAIAVLYARHGASVVCADLQPSARAEIPGEVRINTNELIQKQGGNAVFIKADVGKPSDMENLISQAAKKFGRVDM